ncbi:MAG: LysM peptidoglycan-binding domain-containing protein [Actinobacteria bacterium]|nr:LysM peptidoglycan-binding domain-containing protein [Actinomycetota bacterium]
MALFGKGKKEVEEAKKVATEAKKKVQSAEAKTKAAENAAKIQKARADAAKKKLDRMEAEKRSAAIRKKYSSVSGRAKPGPGPGIVPGYISGAAKKAVSPGIIARHTVVRGDTLSAIAKKYYGSASKPYWELIQKANSGIIKDANLINVGQVFVIPELPEELKKK